MAVELLPVPDPSKLTTEQLDREIAALKEIVFTRLEGMDRALTLATETINRQPTETEKAIGHLRDMLGARMNGMDEIRNEKFIGIQAQFRERDIRFEQAAREANGRVEIALQAAKEAVAKSEVSTIKQLDQLQESIRQVDKTSDDKLADVKDRLNREGGRGEGHSDVWGWIVAAVAALIAILEYKK
jgi:hypothetical protein